MIFSPIVAVALTNRSFNVPPSTATVNASSTLVALALIKVLQVLSNNSKNCSFLATKSVSELISTTIAYFLSSIIGYVLNDKMVFKQKNKNELAIIRYYIVYGTSYLLNMLCMYFYVDVLQLSQYIAPLLVLLITVPYNFILSRLWVFKGDDKNGKK